MNKSLLGIVLGIILLFSIILSIFYFAFPESEREVVENSGLKENPEEPEEVKPNLRDIVISGNIEDCDLLEDEIERNQCKIDLVECDNDDCFYGKAVADLNPQLCYEIEDEAKRNGCGASIERTVIISDSLNNNDIEECSRFTDGKMEAFCRDNFYLANVINGKAEIDSCENIIDEGMKNDCLSQ